MWTPPSYGKNHCGILIVEDMATHLVELFVLREETAIECATILMDEVFLRYGFLGKILSDSGVQFVSKVMQQAMYVVNVKQSFISFFHPSANLVKRRNCDLKL